MNIVLGNKYLTNAHCEAVLHSTDFIPCIVISLLTTGEYVASYKIPERLVSESDKYLIDFEETFICKVSEHELQDYNPAGDTLKAMVDSVGIGKMPSHDYMRMISDIRMGKIPNVVWRED